MCVELAAEHDFDVENPELQQTIAADRERIRMTEGEGAPDREHRSAESWAARTPAEVDHLRLALDSVPCARKDHWRWQF
jgi:hypothetical protein